MQIALKPAAKADLEDFIPWAENIARNVARNYGFIKRSQEEDEIISAAYLSMIENWAALRPELGTDFGGYARRDVLSECQREARRLRNGGTYNTRREEPGVSLVVQVASTIENSDGEPMDVVDYRAVREIEFDVKPSSSTVSELMAMLRG